MVIHRRMVESMQMAVVYIGAIMPTTHLLEAPCAQVPSHRAGSLCDLSRKVPDADGN